MSDTTSGTVSRRGFLGRTLAAAAALPLASAGLAADGAAAATAAAASGYRSLTAAEASITEALVNALCPADHLTPDGVTSGLAAFIDAHLAGAIDAGVHGQRELFKAGLVAADAACRRAHGVPFAGLPAVEARAFLSAISTGEVAADFPLAAWRTEVVDPLLTQACFSGDIYAAHDGRMFWKLFG